MGQAEAPGLRAGGFVSQGQEIRQDSLIVKVLLNAAVPAFEPAYTSRQVLAVPVSHAVSIVQEYVEPLTVSAGLPDNAVQVQSVPLPAYL